MLDIKSAFSALVIMAAIIVSIVAIHTIDKASDEDKANNKFVKTAIAEGSAAMLLISLFVGIAVA